MDLRRLHALLAVAEHRSFSAAATALHTVQSNVSTHIARLERELGAVLIDRSCGELTPEGEIVADRARRVLNELRAVEDDLLSLRDDVCGTVRAGIIGTTALWLVPVLLDAMARDHPRVQITVVEATTTSLLPQLLAGRLDLAIVNLPVDDPDIDTTVLFSEERVVIAPQSHPLAKFDRVDLETLAAHRILLPPVGTAFRDEVDRATERVNVTLRPRAELDGFSLLTSLALQGFAPALVPASALPKQTSSRWRSVAVEGLSGRQVGFALHRRTNPSASTRVVVEQTRRLVLEFGPLVVGVTPTRTTGAAPPTR